MCGQIWDAIDILMDILCGDLAPPAGESRGAAIRIIFFVRCYSCGQMEVTSHVSSAQVTRSRTLDATGRVARHYGHTQTRQRVHIPFSRRLRSEMVILDAHCTHILSFPRHFHAARSSLAAVPYLRRESHLVMLEHWAATRRGGGSRTRCMAAPVAAAEAPHTQAGQAVGVGNLDAGVSAA